VFAPAGAFDVLALSSPMTTATVTASNRHSLSF
jgi:hypothetical protein